MNGVVQQTLPCGRHGKSPSSGQVGFLRSLIVNLLLTGVKSSDGCLQLQENLLFPSKAPDLCYQMVSSRHDLRPHL